mgnify:CR=1 FL=1
MSVSLNLQKLVGSVAVSSVVIAVPLARALAIQPGFYTMLQQMSAEGALDRLLDPPQPPWPEAAARFWSVLSAMPGAPGGLRVVIVDDNAAQRLVLRSSRSHASIISGDTAPGSAPDDAKYLLGPWRLPPGGYEVRVFLRRGSPPGPG